MGYICRTCAREQSNGNALKLFDRRHRELLTQIEDITGIWLKNSGLPKVMCSTCHQSLRQAHQFRENIIKVQSLLADKYKDLKEPNQFDETTEFFQVCIKEEEYFVKSETEIAGENEINIESQDELEYKKAGDFCNLNQRDALELKPNEKENLDGKEIGSLDDLWSESEITADFKTSNIQYEDEKHLSDTLQHNEKDSNIAESPEPISPKQNKKYRKRNRTVSAKSSQEKEKEDDPKVNTRRKREKSDTNNRFICDQCGNHFTCSYYFKLHLRRHAGDRQCACE
ncbi:uncharacterized protein LOC133327872 [Musca vetustissima]|uniref:uncharacterized protein LOC133327872 n=1 Tax=Musca vetustissima TaxID=27455 RepID=UPI002AB7ED90|nr:uncharacterized protein LOC133327872 [Musca vetustissima]